MVYGLLERGVLGLQRETFGLHFDLYIRAADLEAGVDCDVTANLQHDPSLQGGLEPRSGDLEVIGADRDAREKIAARCVACCGALYERRLEIGRASCRGRV